MHASTPNLHYTIYDSNTLTAKKLQDDIVQLLTK
jgi:hypothetical protein